MKLKLIRHAPGQDSTGGIMFIDGDFFCYSCEDEKREIKVAGETRIPGGIYQIKLRNAGGMTKRYATKFPFHRGMLHLQDVPGFKWIYIHVGNTEKHTSGCILVGYGANRVKNENQVTRSTEAYSDLYKMIVASMDAREEITIEITELLKCSTEN